MKPFESAFYPASAGAITPPIPGAITPPRDNSASIEGNRHARRAKTDRLDCDKLRSMLMRYHTGERRVWAVARIPTPEQEDDRRLHRELERLRKERTAHTNPGFDFVEV